VGQRQGLGVALGAPRYVSRIDPLSNTIQLGRREDLETRTFDLERVTFVGGGPPESRGGTSFRASVRIRHRATPVAASLRPAGPNEPARGGRWIVETEEPVWAAAPGQACVFDQGDVVLGGGRIARPATALAASA
jgi:tRNA-specific 2-thiouridylase